jgi:hypothetical protein
LLAAPGGPRCSTYRLSMTAAPPFSKGMRVGGGLWSMVGLGPPIYPGVLGGAAFGGPGGFVPSAGDPRCVLVQFVAPVGSGRNGTLLRPRAPAAPVGSTCRQSGLLLGRSHLQRAL